MLNLGICGRRRPLAEVKNGVEFERSDRQVKPRTRSPVRVNVGGVHYCTTRETLAQCDYFAALLDSDNGFAPQSNDFFVDRDGDLFRHILAYMRTAQRPPHEIITLHRQQLLAEADFYGFDSFRREVEGSTNPHKLRPEDKRIWQDEEDCAVYFQQEFLSDMNTAVWERQMLRDVFHEKKHGSLTPALPAELMLPLLWPCKEGPPHSDALLASQPLLVDSPSAFRAAFDRFTGGLLQDLGEEVCSGLVFAGGSVLHALCGKPASDVDIFIIGTDPVSAEQKLRNVLTAIKRNARRQLGVDAEEEVLELVRSRLCVTAYRPEYIDDAGTLQKPPAIQIVLTTYRSPLEVIMNFDVDCCCLLYNPRQNKVLGLPRALRALRYRTNVADTLFRSPTFERRLEKYTQRGFAVAVPGLDEGALKQGLFTGKCFLMQNRSLLLRLCTKPRDVASHEIRPEGIWRSAKLVAGKHCEAEIIEGLERLILVDRIGRGIVDGDSASSFLQAAILVQSETSSNTGTVALCSELQYRRYKTDGTLEELEDSDADRALRIVRQLMDRQNKKLELHAEQRSMAAPTHPEDKMQRTVEHFRHSSWKMWALDRRGQGKQVRLVHEETSLSVDEHSDLNYFWDIGVVFSREANLDDAEFERIVGVPQRIQFKPSTICYAPFFGRRGQGAYHREHGDWFSNVYGRQ